jgi:hypothetical protein
MHERGCYAGADGDFVWRDRRGSSQSLKLIGEIFGPAPELMAGMSGKANVAPPP